MRLRAIHGLRDALRRLRDESPEEFEWVFLDSEEVALRPGHRPLVEAGLLDEAGRPQVRLFDFCGHFIATDRLDYREEDQVFSLLFEQHYLVRNSSLREGDDVLELCSGSGAYSLFAAGRARAVTGVDLNPRAIAFAPPPPGLASSN